MTSRNAARRHKGSNRQVPRPERIEPVDLVSRLDSDEHSRSIQAIEFWKGLLGDPLFVYFIQGSHGGPVKIGKAADPIKRLGELQCGNPDELRLMAVLLAAEDSEAKLHLHWDGVRVRGEWFGAGLEFALVTLAQQAMDRQRAAGATVSLKGWERVRAYTIARSGVRHVAIPQLPAMRVEVGS